MYKCDHTGSFQKWTACGLWVIRRTIFQIPEPNTHGQIDWPHFTPQKSQKKKTATITHFRAVFHPRHEFVHLKKTAPIRQVAPTSLFWWISSFRFQPTFLKGIPYIPAWCHMTGFLCCILDLRSYCTGWNIILENGDKRRWMRGLKKFLDVNWKFQVSQKSFEFVRFRICSSNFRKVPVQRDEIRNMCYRHCWKGVFKIQGVFKKSFTTLKAYRNLYRGHTQRFELSKCSKTHRVLPRMVIRNCYTIPFMHVVL